MVLVPRDAFALIRNEGDVKFLQPPFLHWLFAVGPVTGTSRVPLTVIALRSAVPSTSISTSMLVIEFPTGTRMRSPRRAADQNISKYSAISHALASAALEWASISERFIITR